MDATPLAADATLPGDVGILQAKYLRVTADPVAFVLKSVEAEPGPEKRPPARSTAQVQGRPDRPKFKPTPNLRHDTPAAEYGEAAREFGANFGTWAVNETDKVIIRHAEGSLVPNAEGHLPATETLPHKPLQSHMPSRRRLLPIRGLPRKDASPPGYGPPSSSMPWSEPNVASFNAGRNSAWSSFGHHASMIVIASLCS